MDIGDWAATEDLNDLYRSLRELGLEARVAELEAYGFTVVEPAQVGAPPGFSDRLLDAVCQAAERRTGRRLDLDSGTSHDEMARPFGLHLFYMLFESPLFEEALLNPTVLALVTYLLGHHCLLSGSNTIIK